MKLFICKQGVWFSFGGAFFCKASFLVFPCLVAFNACGVPHFGQCGAVWCFVEVRECWPHSNERRTSEEVFAFFW